MKSFSARFERRAQKGIVHIIPLLVVVAIAAVAIWFFLNKGGLGSKGTMVPIPPSQLMPFVSAQEARTTICNLKKEELFAQICQSKYDTVSKEDGEKIVELFALIEKIKNDKSISDYDRLLLSQAVFAALPIGDNPENSESFNFYQQSLLSRLKDYLTSQITVYAQGQIMSEEEFKDLMKKDLQNMVDSLSKEDNAWVINVMVSKYSWKDGKAQPLYSHQYLEVFDPFPNNPNVNTKDITYHIQARVGSKASSQTVDVGGPVYKGTSEMIGYSFTIQSWKSQEYTSKEEGVDEKFLVRKRNRSDSSYLGEPYLNNLLDAVKMPSTKRPVESLDEETDQTNAEPKNVTCEEALNIIGKDKCPHYNIPHIEITGDTVYDQIYIGIWCFPDVGTCSLDVGCSNLTETESRPPDYKMSAPEWEKCNQEF